MRLDQAEEGPATRAGQIADGIAARRKTAGDDDLEQLSLDPFGTVRYVCSHPGGVSRAVVTADVIDALRVVYELRRALDGHELSLIRMGRNANVTWQAIAAALGLGSRQAAEQRRQRLEDLDRIQRVERLAAGTGRREVSAGPGRARIAEARWLARNRVVVEGLAQVLATASFCSAGAKDDAEALADVLGDAEPFTGSLLAWISLLLGELEHAAEVPPGLENVLAEAARLIGEWQRVRPPLP